MKNARAKALVSRKTLDTEEQALFTILDGSGRLGQLLVNLQVFLDTAVSAIKAICGRCL